LKQIYLSDAKNMPNYLLTDICNQLKVYRKIMIHQV